VTICYATFDAANVEAVMCLCAAEGWPSFASDAARALKALTAPGVVAVLALEANQVIGFAQALTDGVVTIYLCDIVVDAAHRGRGIGRCLVEEVFRRFVALREATGKPAERFARVCTLPQGFLVSDGAGSQR